jgi:uncharacterized OB-fold protein
MALIERHQRTTDVSHWEGQIPMSYVYTVGRAGEKFFREIINGKIFGARCDPCNITYVPPRTYCEKCFARLEDHYVDVGTKGTVHTFTQCHETYDGRKKDPPSIVAMIRIDGTQGGLVHWIGGTDFESVCFGMPVEAVFKAKKDRVGSILDIKHFRPAK